MAEPIQTATPFANFDIPEGIRSRDLSSLLSVATDLRRLNEESEAAAIRYQGQMDYMDAIRRGASHAQAFQEAAPKMFYRNPGGMTQAFREMIPEPTGATRSDDLKDASGKSIGTVVTFPGGKQQIVTAKEEKVDDVTKSPQWIDLTDQIKTISDELSGTRKELLQQAKEGMNNPELAAEAKALQEALDRKRAERIALAAAKPVAQTPPSVPGYMPEQQTAPPMAVAPPALQATNAPPAPKRFRFDPKTGEFISM